MADVASIIVRIVTEKKGDAGKELEGTAGKVAGVSAKFKKFAVPAAAAGAAVIAFGVASAKSASRLEQAFGGLDAVFGKNAGQVKKWANAASGSVGLAKSEYSEFAAVIGSQLKGMGLPLDQVTGKTNDLIKMGADLAATYGGTTADAVEALSAAFKGETDPIEKYGVTLKQADVTAQKSAMGMSGLSGTADKQATAMATLALVTAKTADAQGQWAKQSGSAAEQSQMASAKFEDMKAALGAALLPAVSAVANMLGKLADVIGKHPKIAQAMAIGILVIVAAILALVAASKVYTAVLVVQGAVASATWLATLGPILLVIAAVALVVAAIVILWKKSSTFRTFVIAMWNAIRTAAVAVARAVTVAWSATWNALKTAAAAVGAFFRSIWNGIRSAAVATANAVSRAWGAVVNAVSNVTSKIKNAFASAFAAVKSAAAGVASAVTAPFNMIKAAVDRVISAVKSLISWLKNIKVPSIKLPKIPGLKSVVPSSVATPQMAARMAAPSMAPLGARATSSGGGAGVVININGAIDAEGAARQVRRLLNGYNVRHSNTGASRGLRTV